MIKMIKKNNRTFVVKDGKEYCFGEGKDGIKRALAYIDIQRFICKVNGVDISTRIDTVFPVRSLVPASVGKTVRYTVEV
jgi:hypothetical protein